MKQQQDRQTQKEDLQLGLSRLLLIVCYLLFFSSSYVANYNSTIDEAWQRWNFLMYFNFTLMFFSLRKEAKNLITNTGYRIVLYLLINYFIDRYFGLKDWSWNDFTTVAFILLELIYKKYKKDGYKKNISWTRLQEWCNALYNRSKNSWRLK